jgi:hypothetical protein
MQGFVQCRLRFTNPVVVRVAKAIWIAAIFIITYIMRAVQEDSDEPRIYYLSELFNSEKDSIFSFAVRWFLWLQLPLITYSDVLKQSKSKIFSFLLAASWYFVVFSGIKLSVFDFTTPANFRYVHYVATGLVQIISTLLYYLVGWNITFVIVLLMNITYTTLFAIHEQSKSNFPDEIFIIIEYLLFLSYILVLYVRDIIQYGEQLKSQTLETFESGSTTGIRLQLSSEVEEVEISEYRSATVEKNRSREREKR